MSFNDNCHDEFLNFTQKYKISLNSQQQKAVKTTDGANLLIAVPGSGKTTVLVARLGYMIICRNILPQNILAMTYTTASVDDMRKRFASVFGDTLAQKINFRTINSVCYEIIRYYSQNRPNPPFGLISDIDRKNIIRNLYLELSESFPSDNDIIEAESAITYIKNMMLTKEKIKNFRTNLPDTEKFYSRYDDILKSNCKMDYDDQMRYALQIMLTNQNVLDFFQNKFQYICVDEAQDTSKLQHTIIKLLSQKSGNIFMVGDEDQSIYGFRAAYPQALMNFKNDYNNASVLFMENNYRSSKEIVRLSEKFISLNAYRYEKKLIATREDDGKVKRHTFTERTLQYGFLISEIQQKTSETAVLYRDNNCAIPLIDSLIRNNIPYRISNFRNTFFTHKTIYDIKAFISLSFDPYDTQAFMQIYYKCRFGISKIHAERACQNCNKQEISVFEALKSDSQFRYSTAKDFEKFISSIRKYHSYDALNFIENRYADYLQKNNIGCSCLEILKTLARREPVLKNFIQRLERLPELIENTNSPDTPDAVILSTIHSAKGLEYDTVYIMDVCDGILPCCDNTFEDRELFEEERRLFYVAMTRAKNNLHIISFKDRACSFADAVLPLKKPENPFKKKYEKSCKSVNIDGFDYTAGRYVIHSVYGMGTITEISLINGNVQRHKITVRHSGGILKSYELETLLSNRLLKPLNTK